MAELISLAAMKLESPYEPIQELIKNLNDQENIPQKYINNNVTEKQQTDHLEVISYMETNILDLELLSTNSSSLEGQLELQKLRSICDSWGCFQLTNHGLNSLMDQVREVTKEFFALPLEEKQKYSKPADEFQGYGGDAVIAAIPVNWTDRLQLLVNPVDLRDFKFWPNDMPNFRKILDVYTNEIKKMQEKILKAVAKSLDLEETSFLKQCGEELIIFANFNYYPPCPFPDRVIGLGTHSDASLITILLQDEQVEGLQVLKDNKWFKVPIIPNALFVNVGDQLEIMSNGALKTSEHKVVINSERERLSMAMPCGPSFGKEIGPLNELIDDEKPPRYKNVKDYGMIYLENLARGVRPINTVKI